MRARWGLLMALLTVAPGIARATPPEASPRPVARASAGPEAVVMAPALALPPATAVSLRPQARPETLRRHSQATTVAYISKPTTATIIGRKGAVCGDPEIRGTTIPPITARIKGCGLADGVRVTSVAGVALSTPAEIDCPTAKALKTWVKRGAVPAVGRRGGGLVALQVAASYACRTRNGQAGAKVSEHGRGHAVDIGGLVLANGTTVSVLKGWGSGAHGPALATMRKAACGPFSTVLGPGSDRFHSDHLHLDTARGRGPYCR